LHRARTPSVEKFLVSSHLSLFRNDISVHQLAPTVSSTVLQRLRLASQPIPVGADGDLAGRIGTVSATTTAVDGLAGIPHELTPFPQEDMIAAE